MQIRKTDPVGDGMYLPAEYAPQAGVILIWPVRPGSWGKDRAKAQAAFGEIIQTLAGQEMVYLLVGKEHRQEAERMAGRYARILEIETDDSWARDMCPTFVTDGTKVRGIHFGFNAWGGTYDGLYRSWDQDAKAGIAFCEKTGYDCYERGDFILEGGSVHSDGEGTLLVTEACLLSQGRNPDRTKDEIEEQLMRSLGARKVLWLPRGICFDETNEHVDNVCAFVRPGEVVLAWTDDPYDPQYELSCRDYEYLASETDAAGRQLIIHRLPIPDYPILVGEEDCAGYEFAEGEDIRMPGDRLAASYVNFYIGNGVVLVPQFGGKNISSDQRALSILSGLFPKRCVKGINSRAILAGGGNIHCITQQIPKGEKDEYM